MVHSCVVCFTNSKNKTEDISFHLFPTDSTRKNLWIHILNLKRPISKWHRVCSKHFSKNSYIFSHSRKCLHSKAVPLSQSKVDENDVHYSSELNHPSAGENVILGSISTPSTEVCEVFPESYSEVADNDVHYSLELNDLSSGEFLDEKMKLDFSNTGSTKVAKVLFPER